MRTLFSAAILLLAAALFFSSCSRSLSPYEAANGKAKCRKSN